MPKIALENSASGHQRYFSSAIFVNALPAKSAGYKDLLTTLLITIVFDLKS